MVVAGVVALAAAPAATAQTQYLKPLGWYDEQAGVPATVQFEDVAANADAQVAVGSDDATGAAVIYRRVADAWQAEQVTMPGSSELVDVDVAPAGVSAWAVGSSVDGAGVAHPLVLRLASNGTWVDESAKLPAGAPAATAVAIGDGEVTIGDAEGDLHTVPAAGNTTTTPAAAAGDIRGIELLSGGSGYAVADFDGIAGDSTVRIYELGPAPILEPAQAPAGQPVDMTALAATAPNQAVALDSSETTWRVNHDDRWVPETDAGLPAARQLDALGSVPGGQAVEDPDEFPGWATEFLAGAAPAAGAPEGGAPEGAIWQRKRWGYHDVDWTRVELPAGTAPLTGVAATRWDDAWAVGASGTILRYWRPPDPEAEQRALEEAERLRLEEEERQRLAEEERLRQEEERLRQEEEERLRQEELARQQLEAVAQEDAPADEPVADDSTAPPPPPPPVVERDSFDMNGVVIDDRPTRRPGSTKRLLSDVRVVRRGQWLVVSFRLSARARVALTAKRGGKVIARTPMRTLRPGRRQLVLRFRGAPPSSLKVVVRRVSGARGNR
jgi:hypothetical protein